MTVALDGGPWLRSRTVDPVGTAIGGACVVRLDPAAVTLWPVDRP